MKIIIGLLALGICIGVFSIGYSFAESNEKEETVNIKSVSKEIRPNESNELNESEIEYYKKYLNECKNDTCSIIGIHLLKVTPNKTGFKVLTIKKTNQETRFNVLKISIKECVKLKKGFKKINSGEFNDLSWTSNFK